ncbi:hypothetical protein D3C73_1159240 [compost metagenome]
MSLAEKRFPLSSRPIRLKDVAPRSRILTLVLAMLMCVTPSFTRYWPSGMEMPDEYSPITTGTLSTLTSLRAAFKAVVGLPPESSMTTANFLPITPPSALTFSTARSTARRTSSPTVALAPVKDRTAPIFTVSCACAPAPASDNIRQEAPNSGRTLNFMVCSPRRFAGPASGARRGRRCW